MHEKREYNFYIRNSGQFVICLNAKQGPSNKETYVGYHALQEKANQRSSKI